MISSHYTYVGERVTKEAGRSGAQSGLTAGAACQ